MKNENALRAGVDKHGKRWDDIMPEPDLFKRCFRKRAINESE